MTDERGGERPLLDQVLDLWEQTFRRLPLAPGDTLSLRIPGSLDLGEAEVERLVETLRARGYSVSGLPEDGRLSTEGLVVSGAARLSWEGTPRASGVPSGTATGTTRWDGSAVGQSPDESDSAIEVLNDVFQMLSIIAEQGIRRGLSPGEAIALMALLIALLEWFGVTAR